jgi:ribosomal protein L22
MADEKDIEETPDEPTVEETADTDAAVEEPSVVEEEDAAGAAVEETTDDELAEAAEEMSAAADAAEAETETEPEEKPKRRSRRKKADEEPVAEEDSKDDEKDADAEKPKRRRRGGEATAGRESARRAPRREPGGEPVIVRAKARYVHHAPRKARLVVDHIRGKDVAEARAILIHTPRAASRDVLKLLDSAIANAENNHELVADELKIHQAFVDEGPTLKRFRPRALGRATRIRKRTSHMTILLTTKE